MTDTKPGRGDYRSLFGYDDPAVMARRQHHKARKMLKRAVRRGAMVRGPCEVGSGCWGDIEAHHVDYAKPFDVRWLCEKHHDEEHRRLRQERTA
jgi:hypothetical protein